MKKRIQGIIIGALAMALLFGGVATAAFKRESINVTYRDIKLVVDGKAFTPKDANLNIVEPFIYNGTTYLPVRAVSQALGKEVIWDGDVNTIYIGKRSPDGSSPVAQIIKCIENREIIDDALFPSANADGELRTMLRRYNDMTSILYDNFFVWASRTMLRVGVSGFGSYDVYTDERNDSPPRYPLTPSYFTEATARIAKQALYKDARQRLYDDPWFHDILDKEGGGSAGMWPNFVHDFNMGYEPELGPLFEEYIALVENLLARLNG